MTKIALIARIVLIFIVVLFVMRFAASAQTPQADMTIDAATQSKVIGTLVKEMNDNYVFPEVAKRMGTDVEDRLAKGEYTSITSAKAFVEKLTSDLQAISRDKHLRVRYSESPIPVRSAGGEPTAEEKADYTAYNKRLNFGFEKVERLQGNIGYIDLRGFFDAQTGGDTVAAALGFVANTNALIFDLRQNGGGEPAMVALVSSYLFGDKRVHLNDLYYRPGNKTEEYWTNPAVSGKKYAGDVYVLTSARTFSGGEEFANNLKVLKRATIVGETTGGGANPGESVRLSEHFGVFLPSGRAINPITKTNWEGTGVEPDIKAPKEQALKIAHIMALKKVVEGVKDERQKNGLKQLIDETQKELDQLKAPGVAGDKKAPN